MFAAEHICDFTGEPAQGTIGGVDDVPRLLDVRAFNGMCLEHS
jgi:hypothetical protein